MAEPVTRRRIAVVPAYNEEATVAEVLDDLLPLVDQLVVVDDGSVDSTRAKIEAWREGRSGVQLITFDANRGMSAAYYGALTALKERMTQGELDPDDLVFTVDADGQHELAVFEELQALVTRESLDALLVQRDLSTYPLIKKVGNFTLSAWASLWAGQRLLDVESGYRVFRLGALADALDYYRGYKYSETVEVAVVLCRLGYKVRNDVIVPVPVFRSRTRLIDAAIDGFMIPVAAVRVWKGRGRRRAGSSQHVER